MSEIHDDLALRLWRAGCDAADLPETPPGVDLIITEVPQFIEVVRATSIAVSNGLVSAISGMPTSDELEESIRGDSAYIDHGITSRSLFPAHAQDLPYAVDYARKMAPRGLVSRFGDVGPVRYLVWDERVAMYHGAPGHGFAEGMRLTCIPGIVKTLQRQFEEAWAVAFDPLAEQTRTALPTPGSGALTEREEIVLAGVIEGAPTKAIASAIGMSPSTVERAIASLAKRFNVTSRSALASVATRYGWALGDLTTPRGSMRARPQRT